MLMADLASGGWVLPGRDVTIVDEAHRLEDAASTFFSVDVSTTRLSRLAGVALKAAQGTDDKVGKKIHDLSTRAFAKLADGIRATAVDLAGRYESARAKKPSKYDDAGIKMLEDIEALAKTAVPRRGDPNADMLPLLASASKEIAEDIKKWHEQSMEKYAYQVARSEKSKWAALKASPIDVSAILKKELFDKGPVICTSATMAVGGSLGHTKKRIGAVNATDLTLSSPFDYKKNCVAYFADDMPEQIGSNLSDEVFNKIAGRISELVGISGGRALVLFTSRFQMTRAADILRRNHPKLNIVMQYEGLQRSDLIRTLKENPKTVLLGVDSMGEGVDVPGDALVMVIITRIPFANPKDPLVEAKCEDIEKNGGSSFGEFMLPNAAMKMKQWFGRLIRTSTDWGVVAVLDCRITRKQYGRFFLQSLPNATGTKDLEVVRKLFKDRSEALKTS
jgi:ATP-dependent DNA helicase DinG